MGQAVSRDDFTGFVGRVEIARLFSNDDAKFDLPVSLGRPSRHEYLIIGSNYAIRCLHEHDWFFGKGASRFVGVITIIETNADHFLRLRNGGAKSYLFVNMVIECIGLQQVV